MKILWFTNSGGNYPYQNNEYNGGGWISTLESYIRNVEGVELYICFAVKDPFLRSIKKGNVSYFPICEPSKTFFHKIQDVFYPNIRNRESRLDEIMVEKYLEIIKGTNPDVIEIFGSEKNYGLIAQHTKVPIVLHLQGLIHPSIHTYFPPGFSYKSYLFRDFNPFAIRQRYYEWNGWKYYAEREERIISCVNNFLGRTKWDKAYVECLNPRCNYYFGGEMLRDDFYLEKDRTLPEKLIIVSTISNPLYKGYDYILRTARILKQSMNIDFEWKVYGNVAPDYIEKCVDIRHQDVSVLLKGVASALTLKEVFLNATVYVHPSYIDNSPNSICEAQLVGCSVIANNVGGVSSLIENNETGILVPVNDPYMLSHTIWSLYKDRQHNLNIGRKAKNEAKIRHNRDKILGNLKEVYNSLIDSGQNAGN